MKVAITGSIACGKSTVTRYLKKKGYKVIDADKIGHDLLLDNSVVESLIKVFGDSILSDNKIDRKKLGNIVFNCEKKLEVLNKIIHPKVREEITKSFDDFYKTHAKDDICILDIALIFEAKMTDLVDKIIVVDVDYNTQLNRLMKRNNISECFAKKIIEKQMSTSEKKKLADEVIDNNKTFDYTFKQVDKIFKNLRSE